MKLYSNTTLIGTLVCVVLITLFGLYASKIYKPKNINTEVKNSQFVAGPVDSSDFPPQTLDYSALQTYFQDLSHKKGARYAYEVLKVAPIGPGIDMHLLGHAVGDILYEQEGLSGITACNNDFRNACSHSIVTGLFYDKGENALPEIAEACRKAPGGVGAYTMCFHGLGHGILAFEGFSMEKAAEMCKKTGTAEKNYAESTQCIGGTVMEIIGGGFHDREIWSAQRPKYLNSKNPVSLCESDFIPANSKFMCYEYITPYLFEAAGGDLGNLNEGVYKKAFRYCDKVPASEKANRDACYGGFGKEFDGIVQARDIRQSAINSMSAENLKQVYNWCKIGGSKEATGACIVHALNSLYWGGENNRDVAIRFCAQIDDKYFESTCYVNLTMAVSYYIQDVSYRTEYCAQLPEEYRGDCSARLFGKSNRTSN
jgi:hypothetical protein